MYLLPRGLTYEGYRSPCIAAVTLAFITCKGLDLGKNLKAWFHLITYCISLYLSRVGFSISHLMHYLLVVSSFHFSFEQLKMAVTHLKRQANKKSEGSLACVKGGLSTFFEAQDALSGKVTLSHLLGLPRGHPALHVRSVCRLWR